MREVYLQLLTTNVTLLHVAATGAFLFLSRFIHMGAFPCVWFLQQSSLWFFLRMGSRWRRVVVPSQREWLLAYLYVMLAEHIQSCMRQDVPCLYHLRLGLCIGRNMF